MQIKSSLEEIKEVLEVSEDDHESNYPVHTEG